MRGAIGLAAVTIAAVMGCAGAPPRQDFSALTEAPTRPATGVHAAVLSAAHGLLGTPYKAGGTTPDGFDCSGFIRYVYRLGAGVDLPRMTHEMITAGSAVPVKDLRPADIVYFKIERQKELHAGIYLGGGRFIHAPSSGGRVNIQPLTMNYWAARYLGARRVL